MAFPPVLYGFIFADRYIRFAEDLLKVITFEGAVI